MNLKHCDYLKKQIEEKRKQKYGLMNDHDYYMNKKLIDDIIEEDK